MSVPEKEKDNPHSDKKEGKYQSPLGEERQQCNGGSEEDEGGIESSLLARMEEVMQEEADAGGGDQDRPERTHVPPSLEGAVEEEAADGGEHAGGNQVSCPGAVREEAREEGQAGHEDDHGPEIMDPERDDFREQQDQAQCDQQEGRKERASVL